MYNLLRALLSTSVVMLCLSGVVAEGSDYGITTAESITSVMQQTNVSGVVFDKFGPVAGASVMVKGTKTGTLTDIDGHFSIDVREGATLVVSFLGYDDVEFVYKGEKELKILIIHKAQRME